MYQQQRQMELVALELVGSKATLFATYQHRYLPPSENCTDRTQNAQTQYHITYQTGQSNCTVAGTRVVFSYHVGFLLSIKKPRATYMDVCVILLFGDMRSVSLRSVSSFIRCDLGVKTRLTQACDQHPIATYSQSNLMLKV